MGPELEAPPVYRELGRPPKYEQEENSGSLESHESVLEEQAYLREYS
jgi:hypothetical protein